MTPRVFTLLYMEERRRLFQFVCCTLNRQSKFFFFFLKDMWIDYHFLSLGFVEVELIHVCMDTGVSVLLMRWILIVSDSNYDSPTETRMCWHYRPHRWLITQQMALRVEKQKQTHITQDNPGLPSIHTFPKPITPPCPWLPCVMN